MLNVGEYEKMSEADRMKWFIENCQRMTEGSTTPASEALSKLVKDDKLMTSTFLMLKKMVDGEPVNKNPLVDIPNPEMRLYFIGENYFETIDELLNYCRFNGFSTEGLGFLEYYRSLANRSDVIRKVNNKISKLYTVVDEYGYGIYNNERSIYRGEFIWEYNHGSIRKMYEPFRDKGIIFENDIYSKQDERTQHILKYCRENNLFNTGK